MSASAALREYLLADLIRKAEMEMRGNNFVAALGLWTTALRINPRSGVCYKGAAFACLEIDEQEQAELLCGLAARFAENAYEPLIIKAEMEQRRGNLLAALRAWGALREKFPFCPEGYERAAQACLQLGDYEQAAELLDKQVKKRGATRDMIRTLKAPRRPAGEVSPRLLTFPTTMNRFGAPATVGNGKRQPGRRPDRGGAQFSAVMDLLANGCHIFAAGMIDWKREFLGKLFAGSNLTYLNENNGVAAHIEKILRLIAKGEKVAFLVWGMSDCKDVVFAAREFSLPLIRVEDGFIRSVGAGIMRIPPCSLCFDSRTMYFDCWRESDLENLIRNFDEKANPGLIARAKKCMDFIVRNRITKYNVDVKTDMRAIYGPKDRKRILVIGQVEDDKSIKFGCGHVRANRGLLEIAIRENPGAQIIFKNHPDLNFGRIVANSSSIRDVENDLVVLEDGDIGIDDALYGVERVYTMTSLFGFEALLRGVPVSVFGAPFYAGWGLCDDRLFTGARRGQRSLEAVFACAYLLYPVYFLPDTGRITTLEEILTRLNIEKILRSRAAQARPVDGKKEWECFPAK